MKVVTIMRLAPGVDNVKKAFGVFGKVGTSEGTQVLYASTDGKTFVTVIDSEEPDIVTSATYAPFFEHVTVIPVVDVDDAWMAAMATAIENMDD